MTLISALESLKAKGIAKLTGMHNVTGIDEYIAHARHRHETSLKYADVPCHRYSLDHEDDHYIVEADGHYIIATHYDGFDMATYSDYATDEEMNAAFDAWRIAKEAEEIADQMTAERPNELPRAVRVAIATAELQAAHQAAHEAFERDYGQAQ